MGERVGLAGVGQQVVGGGDIGEHGYGPYSSMLRLGPAWILRRSLLPFLRGCLLEVVAGGLLPIVRRSLFPVVDRGLLPVIDWRLFPVDRFLRFRALLPGHVRPPFVMRPSVPRGDRTLTSSGRHRTRLGWTDISIAEPTNVVHRRPRAPLRQ